MKRLFDSHGKHIANMVNNQLHSPSGSNIGHYLESKGIFIDMHGRYLGEIVLECRLLYKISSPYQSLNFGSHGNHGNVGNFGNPGNRGSIGILGGYRDVCLED